ncbi:Fic family protein [archaeon]|nr:Fic family protein [archaeon]
MYLEKKKIGKGKYNYLKTSIRYRDKIKTKTIVYLGKENLTEEKLNIAMKKYKKKEEKIKKQTIEELKRKTEYMFLTEQQTKKLEQIKEEYNKKLKILDKKTKEDMFNDFLIIYSYNTNAIEGNTFTLRDTDLLLNKDITPEGKNLREINDHLNAKKVFLHILNNKTKLNHEKIIEIHSMLMQNIDKRVNSYRAGNVRVTGAKFKASPTEYIKADMIILLKWLRKNKNKLHPLVLATVFHHKFEKIHPFYDGNGRTGRILLNIILLENRLPFIIVPNAQRKKYYEALEKSDKVDLDKINLDYKELIKFFYYNLLKTYNTTFNRWS